MKKMICAILVSVCMLAFGACAFASEKTVIVLPVLQENGAVSPAMLKSFLDKYPNALALTLNAADNQKIWPTYKNLASGAIKDIPYAKRSDSDIVGTAPNAKAQVLYVDAALPILLDKENGVTRLSKGLEPMQNSDADTKVVMVASLGRESEFIGEVLKKDPKGKDLLTKVYGVLDAVSIKYGANILVNYDKNFLPNAAVVKNGVVVAIQDADSNNNRAIVLHISSDGTMTHEVVYVR